MRKTDTDKEGVGNMEFAINILFLTGGGAAAFLLYAVAIGGLRSGKIGIDGKKAPFSWSENKITYSLILFGYFLVASFFLCMAIFFALQIV